MQGARADAAAAARAANVRQEHDRARVVERRRGDEAAIPLFEVALVVEGLAPNTRYVVQLIVRPLGRAEGNVSARTGALRTLPHNPSRLRFAVVSCDSLWPAPVNCLTRGGGGDHHHLMDCKTAQNLPEHSGGVVVPAASIPDSDLSSPSRTLH